MIVLHPEVQQNIIQEAVTAYPEVCTGFLYGQEEEGSRRIVTHVLKHPSTITSQDYEQAENYAEKQQLELLGVYYSRPDHSATPSVQDRSVAQPLLSYLIISVNNGKPGYMRSWRLNGGVFEEENNDLLV